MWYLFLVFDYWEENEFSPWPTCYWGLNLRLLWCCCWIMKICYLCLKYYVVTYEHVMFGSSETITERLKILFCSWIQRIRERTYLYFYPRNPTKLRILFVSYNPQFLWLCIQFGEDNCFLFGKKKRKFIALVNLLNWLWCKIFECVGQAVF